MANCLDCIKRIEGCLIPDTLPLDFRHDSVKCDEFERLELDHKLNDLIEHRSCALRVSIDWAFEDSIDYQGNIGNEVYDGYK